MWEAEVYLYCLGTFFFLVLIIYLVASYSVAYKASSYRGEASKDPDSSAPSERCRLNDGTVGCQHIVSRD